MVYSYETGSGGGRSTRLAAITMLLSLSLVVALLIAVPEAQAAATPSTSSITPTQAVFTPDVPGDVTASYSDPDGWQDLRNVFLLISSSPKTKSGAVYVRYNQNQDRLLLRDDANTTWSSCTPGSPASLSNSLVLIDCATVSVSGSGAELMLNLPLSFKQASAGSSFGAFQRAVDDSGKASVWSRTGSVTVASTGTPPPQDPPPASTSRIPAPDIKSYDWVSYYGSGKLNMLGQFGLVDIDVEDGAGNYTPADVAALKAGGSTVVSYLNIGAAETFRSYWSQASAYSLASYDGWPGEYWMDASNPGWRDLIVNTVAPQLVAKGVDGFYLDNIDVVDEYANRPDIRAGVVELVRQLRARYPDKIIIGQTWGLTPLGDTGSDGNKMYQYLDGISKEEVNSTYQGGYRKIPAAESDSMIAELAGWRSMGLEVFTLDYATGESLAQYDYSRSLAAGLRPYAANKNLDNVYLWPFAASSATGQPAVTEAFGPEMSITGVSARWASYSEFMSGLITLDLQTVNVGDSDAYSVQSGESRTWPVLSGSPAVGQPVDVPSGGSATFTAHFFVRPGMRSFLLFPDISYTTAEGDVLHSCELD